jgi:ApbE superfamily uncharacterized protein (UPF0280 family)
MAAVRVRLADGRLHLQHGPIDLVIEAFGDRSSVEQAYGQAWQRFQDILEALVSELALLRSPVRDPYPLARGPVARRMVAAVWPHREIFVTPMAAVAGAVADEMLAAMLARNTLARAYVNDGGDIAVHVASGEKFEAGIVDNPFQPEIRSSVRIASSCGIATSGWRGRSQSLGIADAVTAIARDAATADAAATLLANAVNVDHPAIRRLPAREVKEDSDLGEAPVTVAVGILPQSAVGQALEGGLRKARQMQAGGLIEAAYLSLQGCAAVCAPRGLGRGGVRLKLGAS